jgi:hypothetical protein
MKTNIQISDREDYAYVIDKDTEKELYFSIFPKDPESNNIVVDYITDYYSEAQVNVIINNVLKEMLEELKDYDKTN